MGLQWAGQGEQGVYCDQFQIRLSWQSSRTSRRFLALYGSSAENPVLEDLVLAGPPVEEPDRIHCCRLMGQR